MSSSEMAAIGVGAALVLGAAWFFFVRKG